MEGMVMSGHELHEIARISEEEASSPHPSPPKGEEREMTFSFLHVVPMFRRLSKSKDKFGPPWKSFLLGSEVKCAHFLIGKSHPSYVPCLGERGGFVAHHYIS